MTITTSTTYNDQQPGLTYKIVYMDTTCVKRTLLLIGKSFLVKDSHIGGVTWRSPSITNCNPVQKEQLTPQNV